MIETHRGPDSLWGSKPPTTHPPPEGVSSLLMKPGYFGYLTQAHRCSSAQVPQRTLLANLSQWVSRSHAVSSPGKPGSLNSHRGWMVDGCLTAGYLFPDFSFKSFPPISFARLISIRLMCTHLSGELIPPGPAVLVLVQAGLGQPW